jgi:DNA-binding winged helix-turn-helix (wHTH) protein
LPRTGGAPARTAEKCVRCRDDCQPPRCGRPLIRSRLFTRTVPRYHFDHFVLSPRRRLLLRGGMELPLIPRYFDLLVFLVEHRHEAVHRRDIFDRVWSDSVVSDSALSQAIRTIRRVLDDDPREPRFIRTVSRHGYRFVFPEVIEEDDDGASQSAAPAAQPRTAEGDERSQATDSTRPVGAAAAASEGGATRWIAATVGGTLAGIAAGGVGGVMLAAAPGSAAPFVLAPVLAVIGGGCGAVGGAGVSAGLALAENVARVPRALAMTAGAALGGGAVGAAVQWLTRWALASLFGLDLTVGGGLEGIVIGGAAGLGLAIATRSHDDESAVATRGRWTMAFITAVVCGLAGLALSLTGHPLASGTIQLIADAAEGSRATLAPLGRLIGEPTLGPVSSAILALGETAAFGFGFALGLTRRSNGRRSPDFRRT